MFQMALSRGLLKPNYNTQLLLQSFRCFSSELNFDEMVKKSKVVVFMKGTPKAPRCGFSNAVVQIFKMYGVEFDSYDVLSNEEMRKGIKEFTSWPTIPQVFINGEFVGGCDIITQMHYDKKLSGELEKAGVKCDVPKSQKTAN